jgi:DNA primase
MTNWIDFKGLRKELDFAEVLCHYGVELNLRGQQHHGFCPLPSHEGKHNSPSFSANIKRGIWQCFGCGQHGNVLDFAVLMERGNPESGEDVRRVALGLKRRVVGESSQIQKPVAEPREVDEQNVVINAPLDFELKGLDQSHPYLLKRGFTKETIAGFGLGYCWRGLLRERLAIPLSDREGRLVGYAGRLVDDTAISEENPKYRFPGRRRHKGVVHDFRKSLLVYNADRILAPVEDLVIVEGFTGVWWLSQADIANVVAPMGASCSETQAKIIISLVALNGRVWIFTDGDTAGERCAVAILVRVAPYRLTRWIRVEEGKQPTAFSPSELKTVFPFKGKE